MKYLGVETNKLSNGAITLSMKLKIEKLKELIYPELDLHISPNKLIYDPMLLGWSEDLSDQSTLLRKANHFFYRSIVGLSLFITKVRFDDLHVMSLFSSRLKGLSHLDLEFATHAADYLIYT